MGIAEIIAVILITLIIGAIFYYGLKSRGPWGTFWTFFLILFFGILLAAIWIEPIGPVYWGVAWVPLIFIGFLVALLLAASTPTTRKTKHSETDYDKEEPVNRRIEEYETNVALGAFFWFLITLLFVLVVGGILF